MTRKVGLVAALVVLTSFSVSAQAVAVDPSAPGERNVVYRTADGVEIEAYLALPEGSGPHPAVVLIHEWWGLNHDTVLLADALAREGFVVLAADAFRGSVADTQAAARAQVMGTPRVQIASDLDAAFAFLAAHEAVDASRIASWGFCFGGTQSMFMGTRNPDLAAIVIFYGSGPIQEVDNLGVMAQNGPVLGIYGENDPVITVDEVRTFEGALNAAGVDNTIEIYAEVGHAFVKSDTYNAGGTPERAWRQAVDFLKAVIGG